MTIYITSVRSFAETIRNARERAATLARSLSDAIARARTFTDPDLSDQGVAAKRAELEATFRAAAQTDLQKLTAEVSHARQYLAQAARENTQLPNDAAGLIRAEQKWRQVEKILDAGGDLLSQIRTADADTALAIAEFGPSWVQAQSVRPQGLTGAVAAGLTPDGVQGGDPAASVRRAVSARLADVTTDPTLAELLRVDSAADGHVATVEPWLTAASNLVEYGTADLLGAALASQIAQPSTEPAPAEAAA
ncbi:hypothetical protein [Agromyces humatus]|uniref:Uncharacterized protein n=1 Tax=Agromyces humatus TaxID=279573 RepID=A0ABP4X1Z2_9MICO|nr:hypothetical protein [Agromyces humatus]